MVSIRRVISGWWLLNKILLLGEQSFALNAVKVRAGCTEGAARQPPAKNAVICATPICMCSLLFSFATAFNCCDIETMVH